MTTIEVAVPTIRGGVLSELVRRNALLAIAGLVFMAASAPVYALQEIDPRTLAGVSVWIKPAKFLLSTGLYMATLAWFYVYAGPGFSRTAAGRWTTATALLGSAFEVGYIAFQASRGEPSHFNISDPLHIALYAAMGVVALILTSAALVLGVAIARRDVGLEPSYRWSVVLGLLLTFVLGAGLGGYMSAQSGHVVGAAQDDSAGLWLFGWSRTAGDLRVPHFFGVHAMHVLPLAGLAAARLRPALLRTPAAVLAAVLYAGFTVWTFQQAVAARPFLPF